MKENNISVIIPIYNRSIFLRESLISALSEISEDDELILVDDGSTENITENITDLLEDITLLRKDNGGVASARNFGIKHAKNEWIAFLDSDDVWFSNRFAAFNKVKNSIHNKASAHISNVIYTGPDYSSDLFSLKPELVSLKTPKLYNTPLEIVISGMTLQGAIVRRDAWERSGGFNENMTNYSDTDFFARLALVENFFIDPTVVAEIRRLDGDKSSLTSIESNDLKRSRYIWTNYLIRLSKQKMSKDKFKLVNDRLSGSYYLLALSCTTLKEKFTYLALSLRHHPKKHRGLVKLLLALLLPRFSKHKSLSARKFIRK